MIGGFLHDMVDKLNENRANLPSKKPKFKLGSKFMEGRLSAKHASKQNARKPKVKEISESELEEVISEIKHDAQEEKRKWRLLILPLTILISVLILIVCLLVFEQLLEWYRSNKDYLRVR